MPRLAKLASVSPPTPSLPIRETIAVSRRKFIAIWWLVITTHTAFIVYLVNVIKLHRYFIVNSLEVTINFMGPSVIGFFDAVIVAHAILVACHAGSILQSIGWSLYYREWRFVRKHQARERTKDSDSTTLDGQTTPNATTGTRIGSVRADPSTATFTKIVIQALHALWNMLFGRYGLFGVEGTYYESTFFAMEVVEISLQAFQAYKLSYLVPRVWINRLNTVVLILNCWSTAFVHEFLGGDRLAKRVLLLVVDGIFDTVAGAVIPLVIIYPYYQEFDLNWRDFPLVNYYSDVWLIQAISENRQVFVTSWIDFISKLMPGVTAFGGMMVFKQYVVMESLSTPGGSLVSIAPSIPTKVIDEGTHAKRKRLSFISMHEGKWQHLLLFFAGLAVLIIHIHSTTVAVLTDTRGCLLEVRPWFQTSTTCIALEINCANGDYDDGADGVALESFATTLVSTAIRSLVFASCAQLHVPSMVQGFSGLQMIKIYNCTVVQWDTTAELREDFHPDLQLLYVSDSFFSGSGEPPIGLLGDKFPPTLVDVEFSGTNITKFPANLHEKWTAMQYFVLERNAAITEVPQALVDMKISQLFLGSNGITTIPDELLSGQAFWMFNLNGNPLQAIPHTLGDLSSLHSVQVVNTRVSQLPLWATVDARARTTAGAIFEEVIVYANGTPLCEDAQAREVAEVTKANWIILNCAIDTGGFTYPIEEERKWRAASLANLQ